MGSSQDQLFINRCVSAAALVLLYYDYALTLSDEIERFWVAKPKLTIASALFYTNRYLSLFGHLPNLLEYFWTSSNPRRVTVCTNLVISHSYITVVIQVVVAALLFVRTRALFARNRYVTSVLVVTAITVTFYGGWAVFSAPKRTYSPEDLLQNSCFLPLSKEIATRFANAWTAMVSFDGLVFGLTLFKAVTTKRTGSFSVLDIVMRDGSLYFGVIVGLCISVIVSFYISPDYLRGLTATLTNILSSVMVSRLMLNLRELGSTQATHAISNIAFQRSDETWNLTDPQSMLPTSAPSHSGSNPSERSF
ncbi:hypothetical protein CPB83DRAFT_330507 [Crepidotus variabilis]|uniref:DUF6533 domain-containing protein n=1 Tax=Crepidotus variabilis TaxID=179855 RepID=A0A9P6JWA5_9AGAR|nr:hypothetical protein CPB83DRAFT_330507 [Crepidotus variabilis]